MWCFDCASAKSAGALLFIVAACSADLESTPFADDAKVDAADATAQDAEGSEVGEMNKDAGSDALVTADSPVIEPCATRIHYGSTWFRPTGHDATYDDVGAHVSWDGACPVDGSGNGIATLSNGWKPAFRGKTCVISLEYSGACDDVPTTCDTRIRYGPSWLRADNHPADFDNVAGGVTWSGQCSATGSQSYVELSNGWKPHFSGASGCDVSMRYRQCGPLFTNPVLNENCPDPGVMKDGDTYVMTCTNGSRGIYPIFTSTTLGSWKYVGNAFRSVGKPSWGDKHFWAPEIHKVGDRYVLYFSALAKSGTFAIGAATSDSPTGPFTDLGQPLLSTPSPGVIDAHYFRQSTGQHYLLWKVDGNAVGAPTPIRIQPLSEDGLSLIGSPKTILTNTLSWEGALVEGAFMIEQNGSYYLFYSGNGYGSAAYGVSVARSSSPLGPFTKRGYKLLGSNSRWSGPGHGSIVRAPGGDWVHVYHAWVAGKVNAAPGRLVLVDRVQWQDGWPVLRASPSFRSQPLP